MGRPKDQFAWAEVEKLENGTWKCKHCKKVHSGAASRIRNHLSGQGNGIAACEKASEALRNEALRKVTPRKRVRGNSSAVPTSTATEEITVIDAFVKFLMCCNNVPPVDSDYVVKDPSLREFLESLGQTGVQLSLLEGDSLALKRSVLRIKHEVEHNMLMLKDSWKTTGCTVMVFDLNNLHGKRNIQSRRYEKHMIVIGIYCPKGIIFVEVPPQYKSTDYLDVLERHSPSLYTDEGVHWLRHYPYDHDNYKICQLNHIDNWEPKYDYWDGADHICLRSEIQNLCSRSCLDSGWARNLIDVTVRIHEHLRFLRDSWYCNILNFSLDVSLLEKEASRLPIFLLIIQNYPEEESVTDHRMKRDDIEEITKGSKFWCDGRQLALILNRVLWLADVMDTLVPTSGYFEMALNRVKNDIERCKRTPEGDALQFWEQLKSKIEHIADTKIFVKRRYRLAASYLNPVYYLEQLEKDSQLPAKKLILALEVTEGFGQEMIDEEVASYADVFRPLSRGILYGTHPVKLWEEYGHDLPKLQRCALELLSRPLNCLCEEVKEHLYDLQDKGDYILRLNFRMMRHFQHLRDDGIYQPFTSLGFLR
ncbi:hypothetical protein V2J09_012353 [Rumex salicifolius]